MRARLRSAPPTGSLKTSRHFSARVLRKFCWSCIALALLVSPLICVAENEPPSVDAKTEPPKLVIRGLGLLQDRKLKRVILQAFPENRHDQPFDANFVEDAFVILRNQLVADGYQDAVIYAHLITTDGDQINIDWDGREELKVPRPLSVQEARFDADQRQLFYYNDFKIEGLTAMPTDQATGFFYKTEMLLRLKSNRRFSRRQLNDSVDNLRQELVNLGYRDARVTVADLQENPATGAVDVLVRVEQGKLYRVNNVNVVVMDASKDAVTRSYTAQTNAVWSPTWQQDFSTALRNDQYSTGHPDARVQIKPTTGETNNNTVIQKLEAVVHPGPEVKLGDVRFEGQQKSRLSWLQKKGRVEGPLLDRLKVDAARERLSRQGVFDFVSIRYEPDTGPERDVVFDLDEGKRIDFSLLAGYGSYDQFFGGAELDQYNLWGIGHSAQLRGMISVKTENVVYTYSVPEFLIPNLNVFANVDGLLRKELTFERQEIKTALGLRKSFPKSGLQAGIRYSYQFLKTQDSPDPTLNNDFARVSAIILDGQLERRDNPLSPRKGYRIFGNVEVANPALASDADYEMVQFGASGHLPLVRGLVLHSSIQHGVIFSPDPSTDLPFSKRFLPGGENSVRGYQRGGASPYNSMGQQIGAETFLQWNVELEQFLTERWSVVAFLDGAGISPTLDDYPFDEVLWSVGGGLRWNTIIGPVRVEYGYNLNRRTFDPEGTLHIAIGFPF